MRILVISTMRDEGPHLLEWIGHHRALGVTDFLIYTNDCTDGTDALLRALAPAGVVQVDNRVPRGRSVQWTALKAGWRHPLRKAADWVLGLDCDEFLALRPPLDGLPDLAARMGEADAAILPWRLFGHNGERRLRDVPTAALFTRAAPPDLGYPAGARQFKTLFRARGAFGRMGVHRPRARVGARPRWVDAGLRPLSAEFSQNEQQITHFARDFAQDLVQLNHYSLRSAQSFLLKRARGLPNRTGKALDLMYWVERNFNTVDDTAIARHAAGTAAELARLRALPGVADLHAQAHAIHHRRFEELLRDPEELKLYGRLLMASGSTPLPPAEAADLLHRYRALA